MLKFLFYHQPMHVLKPFHRALVKKKRTVNLVFMSPAEENSVFENWELLFLNILILNSLNGNKK